MGVALQVLLLVAAIVVAVGGIGLALALRMSARPRPRTAPARPRPVAPPRAMTGSAQVVPLARARAEAAAAAAAQAARPSTAATPEEAHKAKLDALQALLALGDAKASSGKGAVFDDTQPAGDAYASTQFSESTSPSTGSGSLLDLDRTQPDRKPGRG